MNVESKANEGCERYLDIDVKASNKAAPFDLADLDHKGRKCAKKAEPYFPVCGKVTARWLNRTAQQQCQEDQTGRKRWCGVLKYAKMLRNGSIPPPPVFLAPCITGGDLYRNIDGARRIMAIAEADSPDIKCVILRRENAQQSPPLVEKPLHGFSTSEAQHST